MAALCEEMFRMSFLKIVTTDFLAWNLSRDGKHRNAVTMAIIKAVDQVQVSGAAAGQFAALRSSNYFHQLRNNCQSYCRLLQPESSPVFGNLDKAAWNDPIFRVQKTLERLR